MWRDTTISGPAESYVRKRRLAVASCKIATSASDKTLSEQLKSTIEEYLKTGGIRLQVVENPKEEKLGTIECPKKYKERPEGKANERTELPKTLSRGKGSVRKLISDFKVTAAKFSSPFLKSPWKDSREESHFEYFRKVRRRWTFYAYPHPS